MRASMFTRLMTAALLGLGTMSTAACLPKPDTPEETLGHFLTEKGGWNEYKDPKNGPDGTATSPASTADFTCIAYFMLPADRSAYHLTKIVFDKGIMKKGVDAKKYVSPGPDISASDLPEAFRAGNLKKKKFAELVKAVGTETDKHGKLTALANDIRHTCQPRKGWSQDSLQVPNLVKKERK